MSADLSPGTCLGAFVIEATLGHGGMGAVYRARNQITGDRRAIKVVLADYASNPEFRARFVREMRVASSIEHLNVVRVFEPSMDGTTMFLPMELLVGVTLRQYLSPPGGPQQVLSFAEAMDLFVPLCRGVAAIHARGVVHRDIKPTNVMLVEGGDHGLVPKILDFGAARDLDDHEHTISGQLIGTLFYMALEQAEGRRDLDARVDVHALGVILYEMLTGVRPYVTDADGHALSKILRRTPFPTVSALVPSLPAGLDAVVSQALAHDRDQRYPSVDALLDALVRVSVTTAPPRSDPDSAQLVVETHAPGRSSDPRRIARWVGIALPLTVIVLGWAIYPRKDPLPAQAVTHAPTLATPSFTPSTELLAQTPAAPTIEQRIHTAEPVDASVATTVGSSTTPTRRVHHAAHPRLPY